MRTPIYINGKFYGAGLNGVHRVADRLIHELDRFLREMPEAERPPVRLLLPRSRPCWRIELQAIEVVEQSFLNGQVWEQLVLPFRARDGLLLNLCNLAPLIHRNKVTMIHDAQFHLTDSSYPLETRLLYKVLSPAIARSSRRVITVSDSSRQMLDLMRVARREEVMVLHNGADHLRDVIEDGSILDEHRLRGAPFVVHVASPKAYKNTKILLDAFRRPPLKPLKLVLVGAGRAELEEARLEIAPDVMLLGKVSDGQLAALYRSAVCIAFPSRAEGFGLPPAEAMSLGCPAVVAPAGAIAEVCGDAVLYAGVDDAGAWADAILQLHEDPVLRAAKVQAGLARMSRMTWLAAGRGLAGELLRLTGGWTPQGALATGEAAGAYAQHAAE